MGKNHAEMLGPGVRGGSTPSPSQPKPLQDGLFESYIVSSAEVWLCSNRFLNNKLMVCVCERERERVCVCVCVCVIYMGITLVGLWWTLPLVLFFISVVEIKIFSP